MEEMLEPDALVAMTWAGLPPYFSNANFRFVDFLGYNNRTIARMAPYSKVSLNDLQRFDPGHIKWNIPYIVDEMKPDAIYTHGSVQKHLERRAHDYDLVEGLFWLRRGSDKVIAPPAGEPAT